MKYKKYDNLSISTCAPVEMPILTQPNSALKLREILERYSNGDNSVLSHLPVDDFVDEQSDEEWQRDDSDEIPVAPEDEIQAQEFITQQQIAAYRQEKQQKQEEQQQQEPSEPKGKEENDVD